MGRENQVVQSLTINKANVHALKIKKRVDVRQKNMNDLSVSEEEDSKESICQKGRSINLLCIINQSNNCVTILFLVISNPAKAG
jgi:hypothetical protein